MGGRKIYSLGWIRLALIPIFILAISYQDYRLFNWTISDSKHIFAKLIFLLFCVLTILGPFLKKGRILEFIDPILNKLMVIFLFLKLGFPKWITYIVIIREMLVVIGWFIFYNLFPDDKFGKEKGLLGKGAFIFQILVIFLYLFYGMTPLTYFFTIVMLTFIITSLVDYLVNA